MNDSLFMLGAELDALVGFVGQYVAFGIGFAAVCWLMGYVVWFVIDLFKGGV